MKHKELRGLEMTKREILEYLLERYCSHYDSFKDAKQYADDSKAFKFLADEYLTLTIELECIIKECFDVDAFDYWLKPRDI